MRYRHAAWIMMYCASVAGWNGIAAAQWKPHSVGRLNGESPQIRMPAKRQIVSESWNCTAAVPYLVYMPEKDRLLMTIGRDNPHQAMVMTSDDHGATWSKPTYLHVDAKGNSDAGMTTGLTYLGNGKLIANGGPIHWLSDNYGAAWTRADNPAALNGKTWYEWDPLLIDKDAKTGNVARLMSFCSDNLQADGHFQGYIRSSTNGGAAWTNEIKVPQMYKVNEVAFLRAHNGDIVAACRTDNPPRFAGSPLDHYNGLAVSISKDNGATWSELNVLYDFGRHHPSMVLMPNNDIVMTYVVRLGYDRTSDGFPQYGIEAVVSRDNGQTWDLSHRYVLDKWTGNRKGANECAPGPQEWWASSQATSTLLLPDATLLTAFGTGYRSQLVGNVSSPRDIGLIQWRPAEAPAAQSSLR
jgi:hypothetical protein